MPRTLERPFLSVSQGAFVRSTCLNYRLPVFFFLEILSQDD